MMGLGIDFRQYPMGHESCAQARARARTAPRCLDPRRTSPPLFPMPGRAVCARALPASGRTAASRIEQIQS